jgi:CDP-diacylglycerol--glycerol-3-phosphate 3-phosphatidyltransferase
MRGSRVLPPRVSEVVGVAHIKAYVFDDTVLLSGANLSNTYFSTRQDRYYVFHDAPELAGHIRSIVQACCSPLSSMRFACRQAL